MSRDEAIKRVCELAREGYSQRDISAQMTEEGYPITQGHVSKWLLDSGIRRGKGGKRRTPANAVAAIRKYWSAGFSYNQIIQRVKEETGHHITRHAIKIHRIETVTKVILPPKSCVSIQDLGIRRLIVTDDPRRFASSPDGRVTVKRSPVRLSDGCYGYKLHSSKTGSLYFRHETDEDFFKGLRSIMGRFDIERQAA